MLAAGADVAAPLALGSLLTFWLFWDEPEVLLLAFFFAMVNSLCL